MRSWFDRCLAAMSLLLSVCGPAVGAESFEGVYVSGGLGYKSTTIEAGAIGNGSIFSAQTGDHSFFGQFEIGYSFAFSPEFRLALGAFIDAGNGKAGNFSFSGGGTAFSGSIEETRHYGISLEPGYAFSKDGVAYAKLMYNWAKGEVSGTNIATESDNFNAFGYGLGVKHLIGRNLYLKAEWQYVKYNSKSSIAGGITSTVTPKQSLGLFSLGYSF